MWNYNTLSEPTKSMLKDKLKNEWFRELGIEGKNRDYFYNKHEFGQYQEIMGLVTAEEKPKKEKNTGDKRTMAKKIKAFFRSSERFPEADKRPRRFRIAALIT